MSFHKQDYDYLSNFVHDWEELGNFLDICLTHGTKLINKHVDNSVNKSLFNLDSVLSAICTSIYIRLGIFAFRWNECFSRHFGMKANNKNNWYYFMSEINNFEKHLDREINDFFHGTCYPKKYMDKKFLIKLNKLYNSGHKNIYAFIKYISSAFYKRHEIIYRINKDNNFDAFKNYLKITTFKEYCEINNKFCPLYDNTLTKFINLARIGSYDSTVSLAIEWFNKKTKISKKVKKFCISKHWHDYVIKIQEVCFFNCFIIYKFKDSNFNNLDEFKKSELYINKDNLWGWYEENRTNFLELYKDQPVFPKPNK